MTWYVCPQWRICEQDCGAKVPRQEPKPRGLISVTCPDYVRCDEHGNILPQVIASSCNMEMSLPPRSCGQPWRLGGYACVTEQHCYEEFMFIEDIDRNEYAVIGLIAEIKSQGLEGLGCTIVTVQTEGISQEQPDSTEASGIERCTDVFCAAVTPGESISVPCRSVTITMTTQGPLPPRIQIVDADGFAALVADRKRLTDTLHQVDDLLSADFIVAQDGDYRTALMEWLRRNIEIHDDPTVSEAARDREEYRCGLEAVILAIKESCGMGPDAPNELMAAVIGDALRRKNASIEAMAKELEQIRGPK